MRAALTRKTLCKPAELLRIALGQFVRQAEAFRGVVKLPDVFIQRVTRLAFPRRFMDFTRPPPFVIDGTVAGYLEIPGRAPFFGVGILKQMAHSGPVHRVLRPTIRYRMFGQAVRIPNGRSHVNHVVDLVTLFALGVDTAGPMNHRTYLRAAKVRSDLPCPLEGRVKGHGPSC